MNEKTNPGETMTEERFKQWWDKKGKWIGVGGLITYDDWAKAIWLEATRLAYEDAVRVCKERFEDEANCCAAIIQARLKELTHEI